MAEVNATSAEGATEFAAIERVALKPHCPFAHCRFKPIRPFAALAASAASPRRQPFLCVFASWREISSRDSF